MNFVDPSGMFGFTLCFGGCIGWNNGVTVGIGLVLSWLSSGDGSSWKSSGAMPFGKCYRHRAAGCRPGGVRRSSIGRPVRRQLTICAPTLTG